MQTPKDVDVSTAAPSPTVRGFQPLAPLAPVSASADGVGRVRQVDAAAAPWLDLNGNGVPDYREPWLWRLAWRVLRWGVLRFAPPKTVAHRAVRHADDLAAQLERAAQP